MSEERRAEIDSKQSEIASLLAEASADWLLLVEPANIAWFCGAAITRGCLDPAEQPALLLNAHSRWVVCSNVDAPRLFDTALDQMGFQLKEWPWYWPREQLLGELCQGRKVAFDRPFRDFPSVSDALRRRRLVLTTLEQARLRQLGAIVSHALEATCRGIERGQCEEEVAGQLSHRLWHRGAEPLLLTVAGDGRGKRYRRPGVTAATIDASCTVMAVASRGGLHLQASRTVCLTPPSDDLRAEHDAACKVMAAQAAAGIAGAIPADALQSGRTIARVAGAAYEYDWRLCPQGHLTGWRPSEGILTRHSPEPLPAGAAVVWQASVGAALVADTFLIGDSEPTGLTPAQSQWPAKRVKVQGRTVDVPDLLIRSP